MKQLFSDQDFKISSACFECEHCVSVAYKEGVVAVRDTKDSAKATLQFTEAEWQAFIRGVKKGEFDF
jgi:hypothetical protein